VSAIDYISVCYCAMWLPSRSDNFMMTLSVLWLNVQLEGVPKIPVIEMFIKYYPGQYNPYMRL